MIDGREITELPNDSDRPVTTAVYTIAIVMNESEPNGTPESHIGTLAAAFRKALTDGYFTALRYDALDFEVVSRIPVVTTQPDPSAERHSLRETANGEYKELAKTFETIEGKWDPDADFASGPPSVLMNELVTLAARATGLSKRAKDAQLGEVQTKVDALRKSIRTLLGMEF